MARAALVVVEAAVRQVAEVGAAESADVFVFSDIALPLRVVGAAVVQMVPLDVGQRRRGWARSSLSAAP
eukprot:12186376-Heterocapsa_arctica.AAC.1